MKQILSIPFLLALLLSSTAVSFAGGYHYYRHSYRRHYPYARSYTHRLFRSRQHVSYTHSAYGANRDSHGRIERNEVAKREFMRMTGYPHGRPGYVIDHVIPLKRGGADDPSNMQWQTIEEAKEKDKWE